MEPGTVWGRDADIAGVLLQVPGCSSPKGGCFAVCFAMSWGAFLDRGTERPKPSSWRRHWESKVDGIAGRRTADPVCPQEHSCALPALLGTSERLWLWFGESIFGMLQENATPWLGAKNMTMAALRGEGKISSGKSSTSDPCMEDPPCASHWHPPTANQPAATGRSGKNNSSFCKAD